MFCVYVASMCGPSKANVELVFEGPPSIAQVMSRAAVALERLASLRGVRGFEFAVSFAMCFDDFESHWVPLERSTQLVHNCQLYIFLPDVVDLPGEIPDPVSANQFLGDYSSPERGVSPAAASVPRSSSPRAEMPSTFTQLPQCRRYPPLLGRAPPRGGQAPRHPRGVHHRSGARGGGAQSRPRRRCPP